MQLNEEQRDLFTVPKEYILVHCISADLAMGAGIAKEFTKRGVKAELEKIDKTIYVGSALNTQVTGWAGEVSLVTKPKYYYKPTYGTLSASLLSLKACIQRDSKIAMPKIGCGLDRLDWVIVKQILTEIFNDTDVEILVCYI